MNLLAVFYTIGMSLILGVRTEDISLVNLGAGSAWQVSRSFLGTDA